MTVKYELGEVCEHGKLKRQCDICSLLDERKTLAKALREIQLGAARLAQEKNNRSVEIGSDDVLMIARVATRALREIGL